MPTTIHVSFTQSVTSQSVPEKTTLLSIMKKCHVRLNQTGLKDCIEPNFIPYKSFAIGSGRHYVIS